MSKLFEICVANFADGRGGSGSYFPSKVIFGLERKGIKFIVKNREVLSTLTENEFLALYEEEMNDYQQECEDFDETPLTKSAYCLFTILAKAHPYYSEYGHIDFLGYTDSDDSPFTINDTEDVWFYTQISSEELEQLISRYTDIETLFEQL